MPESASCLQLQLVALLVATAPDTGAAASVRTTPAVLLATTVHSRVAQENAGISTSAGLSFGRTRLQTLDHGKQDLVDVDLRVESDALVIASDEAMFVSVPYSRIKNVQYDTAQN